MTENLSLFSNVGGAASSGQSSAALSKAPLAEKMRPESWDAFHGLETFDPKLISFLKAGEGRPPSLILWGPPGSGKTTLARLIGKTFSCHFISFSAVLGGVKEVREIVATAKRSGGTTLLFVDEIHRFNKSQQDAFLPHVEDGTIVLIGATTENPSFYLTSALLSRVTLVNLRSISTKHLGEILRSSTASLGVSFSKKAGVLLCEAAGGDARRLLNFVESFAATEKSPEELVSEERICEFLKDRGAYYYDRDGEEHYNMVSAFIKSMRGSDPDAALYWGFRMLEGGEDPRFLIRRMIIFASEDISNADPHALNLAVSTLGAFEHIGLPEGRIPIAQCITYLACAPKSNRSYSAMHSVLESIREHPKIGVPMHLRNAPTKVMKSLGYGENYQYPHNEEEGYVGGVQYLPDEIAGQEFYKPSTHGMEAQIKERHDRRKQGESK